MTDGQLPVASVVLPAAEVEETPTETLVEGETPDAEATPEEGAAPAEAKSKSE
jgi:hypothetical protein